MELVVPLVVEVAEDALARRKYKETKSFGRAQSKHEKAHDAGTTRPFPAEPLLEAFLLEAQYLIDFDSSGSMKRDIKKLRSLLSPAP